MTQNIVSIFAITRRILTKTQVAQRIAVRYQFSYYFAELLRRLLAKMPAGACRKAIKENLDEEMGTSSRFPCRPHWQQRLKLLEALGATGWIPKGDIGELDPRLHPTPAKVITKFRQLIDSQNWLTGFGAIAMSERQAGKHFQILLNELERTWPKLPAGDKTHLVDHAGHDQDHAAELFNAFQTLSKADQQTAFATGMLPAYQAWLEFWTTLNRQL